MLWYRRSPFKKVTTMPQQNYMKMQYFQVCEIKIKAAATLPAYRTVLEVQLLSLFFYQQSV
jgi:hypothetical protein